MKCAVTVVESEVPEGRNSHRMLEKTQLALITSLPFKDI